MNHGELVIVFVTSVRMPMGPMITPSSSSNPSEGNAKVERGEGEDEGGGLIKDGVIVTHSMGVSIRRSAGKVTARIVWTAGIS